MGSKNTDRSTHIKITNAFDKTWFIPLRHMKTGLCMFPVFSFKGAIFKACLPILAKIHIKIPYIEYEAFKTEQNFMDKLEEIFGKSLELSVFMGTPCVHRKTTIQISRNKKILGYVKCTDRTDIHLMFEQENLLLRKLEHIFPDQVPVSLGVYNISNQYLFAQTSKRTLHSKVIFEITAQHIDFISKIHENTSCAKPFNESKYYKMLYTGFTYDEQNFLEKTRERIHDYFLKSDIKWGLCHRDFTPWNCFFIHSKLYVFDFEYARMEYPPYLDLFHFFTQDGFVRLRHTPRQVYMDYKKKYQETFSRLMADCDMMYLAYLFDFFMLYYERCNGDFSREERKAINERIELMKMLNHGVLA